MKCMSCLDNECLFLGCQFSGSRSKRLETAETWTKRGTVELELICCEVLESLKLLRVLRVGLTAMDNRVENVFRFALRNCPLFEFL